MIIYQINTYVKVIFTVKCLRIYEKGFIYFKDPKVLQTFERPCKY